MSNLLVFFFFFFSSRRRHTRCGRDWSSDVCSSDLLRIVPYYDRSELVDAALHTVTKVLEEGIVLVVIVLFLFLGDLRSSAIVIATLILTPVLTFAVMNRYGISANLMSLGGLAIAIGLMVDGSVVVVENVFGKLSHHRAADRM